MDTATEQQDISRYTIPLSESKAKDWIDSLSVTDFGESTKRVYHGLVDLNRRALPPMARVRIGEKMRPKLDVLVNNLQRHLGYRALPLPERSQRIFDLNQSLLLEFAGLYQLAALDMLTRNEGNRRALQIAIYRVIDYLGQYLLYAYSVYNRTRETVWHDIHHMYLISSERGIDMLKFTDGRAGAASIEARYIQVNLLALFKPYSLRQQEILRVARYIENMTHLVKVSQEPLPQERVGDFVHAAMLNNDEPAVIMPFSDLPHSPTVRVFNLRGLLMEMDQMIENTSYEQSSALLLGNGLSRNLLKRMVFHLTTVRNRDSVRFPKQEKLALVMGMQGLLPALASVYRNGSADEKREEDLLFNNMLHGENAYSYSETEQKKDPINQLDAAPGMQIWDMINSSVGGYGLHWPHREPSAARVGELVGVRDLSTDSNPFMVGVIKWIESVNKKGLYCGIELLSAKLMALSVTLVANRSLTHHFPIEGLMLPSIEGVRPDPVLILPAYIFQPGDEVHIKFQAREERVALTMLDECLGAFAYFRFKTMGNVADLKNEEDFDSLWNSL